MNKTNPTNKQKVFDFLKNKGESSIEEISQGTLLEKKKVRNVVGSDYTGAFVFLGEGDYDLAINALKGARFRYQPQEQEIRTGVFGSYSSMVDFLFYGDYQTAVELIDQKNKNYLIKYKVRGGKTLEKMRSELSSVKRFFQNNKIDASTALVFTVLDFEKKKIRVEKILKEERKSLKESNRYIADLLYQFLKKSLRKNDFLLFLNRRILPFYKKSKVAPDLPEKILSEDKRFILYDFYSKKPIDGGSYATRNIGVGLRKYGVRLPNGELGWAVIEKDRDGYYGFCEHCGIPLFWHKRKGWYHPEEDVMEFEVFREDVELDREFFRKE